MRKLTVDEIDKVRLASASEGNTLWHVRNYFLFSLYCAGIRFRDVCQLKVENVAGGRLFYRMSKTGNPKNIDIPPVAAEILRHYVNDDSDREARVFPILDGYNISTPEKFDRAVQSRNAIVNKNLKKLAELAGINPRVSFHMSRHSFADLALKSGWGIKKIQAALGHANVRVTENYLKDFDPAFIGSELSDLFGGS